MVKNPNKKAVIKKELAMKKTKPTTRKKQNENFIDKKKILNYIIFILLLISTAMIAGIFLQKISNDIIQNQNPISSANALKTQAIEIMHKNPTKAKTLFQQAREKYQSASDTNNIVDVEAQIYLIDHVVLTR